MSKKQKNLIVYLIISLISISIMLFLKINFLYTYTLLFIFFSLFLIFNYYNDKKYKYCGKLYILWTLVMIVYNIFSISLFSLFISLLVFSIIMFQYHKNMKRKKEQLIFQKEKTKSIINEVEIDCDKELIKNKVIKLYKELQMGFANLNYNKLKNILSDDLFEQYSKQMLYFEKLNKRVVRDNIIINDVSIVDYKIDKSVAIYKINLDVYEDKYSVNNENNSKIFKYQSVYELIIKKDNKYYIDGLKLLYSHTKRS